MKDRKQAVLYRMVMAEHSCPFGIKSKDLLSRKGFMVEDNHLKTKEETDQFKVKHNVQTTPQTFIGGQRVGGYDDLRKYFGIKVMGSKDVSYQPVIAVFSMTFLMALAVDRLMGGTFNMLNIIEMFISFSMCVLAILKLRDLESFSNQFINYDLLAKRVVPYAYIYPFAEAFAGVGMIAHVLIPIVAVVALFIGTVGSVSVIKAVYIDKRELKCACVGGNSNVPLGFISLTESLMMVAMAVWMFMMR